MKPDPILEEVWQIKDALSHEMEADPSAHAARLQDLIRKEESTGRKIIRSVAELRRFVMEESRKHDQLALAEKPSRYGNA